MLFLLNIKIKIFTIWIMNGMKDVILLVLVAVSVRYFKGEGRELRNIFLFLRWLLLYKICNEGWNMNCLYFEEHDICILDIIHWINILRCLLFLRLFCLVKSLKCTRNEKDTYHSHYDRMDLKKIQDWKSLQSHVHWDH